MFSKIFSNILFCCLTASILLTNVPKVFGQLLSAQTDNSRLPLVLNDVGAPSAIACSEHLAKQSDTNLQSRFGPVSLAHMCNKKNVWVNRAIRREENIFRDSSTMLSDSQLDWLKNIRLCKTPTDCVNEEKNQIKIEGPPSKVPPPSKPSTIFRRQPNFPVNAKRRQKRQDRLTLKPVMRKEYRVMTDDERQRFQNALNRLKKDTIDGRSKYDILTVYHTPEHSPGAHWGPALLPWHRELLKQLEVAIRAYDTNVSMPYWDSTLDEGLPDPRDSIIWSDKFFGNGRGPVITGPFANWTAYHQLNDSSKLIMRDIGNSPYGSLFRPNDLREVMRRRRYDQLTACVDPFFELLHGAIHTWVGGHMEDLAISPNDPVFFMHHVFVDYIWEKFRLKIQGQRIRELEYPRKAKACTAFHYASAMMLPFPKRNVDGLRDDYTMYFYEYDDVPTCRNSAKECKSDYLFCEPKSRRCLSKIKLGGNCTGMADTEICYSGYCNDNGVCEPVQLRVQERVLRPQVATIGTDPGRFESSHSFQETTNFTNSADETSSVEKSKPMKLPNSAENCQCENPALDGRNSVNADWLPRSPNIWFPITILNGDFEDKIKMPASSVNLQTYDSATQIILEGRIYSDEVFDYPYYPGAAAFKVVNPREIKGGITRVQMFVRNANGDCKAHCFQEGIGYTPCSSSIIINQNRDESEDLEFTNTAREALYLAWDGRKRKPTKYLFLCSTPEDRLTVKTFEEPRRAALRQPSCHFLLLEGFILIGPNYFILEGVVSMDECKQFCITGGSGVQGGALATPCRSLMYWPIDLTCSISNLTRHTNPELFHNDRSKVTYAEYVCGKGSLCED